MVKKKDLGLKQREQGLIKLIADAERLGFNGLLVEEYKKQLEEVQAELKDKSGRLNVSGLTTDERGFN